MGTSRYTVLGVTLVAVLALHSLSSASLSSSGDGTWAGIFTTAPVQGDSAAIAELLSRRDSLKQELAQLGHVVARLEQMDLAADLASMASPSLRAPLNANASPPPPPPPRDRPVQDERNGYPGAVRHLVTNAAGGAVKAAVSISEAAASAPPQAAPQAAPPSEEVEGPSVYFDEKGPQKPPASLRDFPCALRNFKRAQVTTTCEIDCGDSKCSKARETCARFVECHAMVVHSQSRGSDLARATAVLKTDSARSRDDSLKRLQANKWWGSSALSSGASAGAAPKPRIYIVASYGGCGSKMMAGWLSQLPHAHKTYTFHLHDRSPPAELRSMPRPPPPSIKGRGGGDYRTGRFPGGSKFKTDTAPVPPEKIDDYRVIFLYKDPVEALVSRYGYGHCLHIQGDCGDGERSWPKLWEYASAQRDRMRLLEHFRNYVHPSAERNYPVIAVNYHKLWDNLPAVMAALGLPPSLEKTFPKRTETVRNDATGKAEGNLAHTEATRNDLRRIYQPLIDEVTANPAVLVV